MARPSTLRGPLLARALLLAVAACAEAPDAPSPAGPTAADGTRAAPPAPLALSLVWERELKGLGSSSPRVADLNGDGLPDLVLGLGRELQYGAVVALDGGSGATLWTAEFDDEVFATAHLQDLDGDGVQDVVAGSRKLMGRITAVSGRDASRIWGLRNANPDHEFPPTDFDTLTPCPDVDGDGLPDLVGLQAGGDDLARHVGRLYVLSAATGAILRTALMPDGRESYATPALDLRPDGARLLLGTGGETLPGHVFCLDFPSLDERWRFDARGKKGVVAGLVVHDFDGRGRADVLATAFHGMVARLDGDTGEPVWTERLPGCESYVTPALGRFNDDEVLDVCIALSEGRWPVYETRAVIRWLDGRDGRLLDERDWGVMVMSSAVVLDVDHDGHDEVLALTNLSYGTNRTILTSRLELFDGRPGRASRLVRDLPGFAAATPWIGDLDGDGRLDLLVVTWDHAFRFVLEHEGPLPRVRSGQYRGPTLDGRVPRDDAAPGAR